MENGNPLRTLGDYSRPSHEGYQNIIELPEGNNVVPLRSDTIRLVQNGCSFHGLRSKDLNQHLKDFLKYLDSLDLNVKNKEKTRLRLFQFSLRDQASNWLERLPARSISTWEDLTTRFLDQFFPPRRTAKLSNNILMFQQHQVQIFYDHVNPATRRTIDQSAGGKLRDKNAEESWALIEDLALYNNKSWNDLRDFAKLVKAISLPHDVLNTSDRRLIKLEDQVQRLMEAHLAPKSSVQVKKIASSCEICSGPHETQYCMDNLEQAFVDYASSPNNEVGGEQNGNSSTPKRVHFVNTITKVRKEDEPEEPRILELNAIKGDDRNLDVYDENILEGESRAPNIIEEEESSDLGNNNKTSNLGDGREIGEEEKLMEYDQPLDLVDMSDELLYETLIEKMTSCSLNFNFRIKKGDPINLKIPCMIGRKFIANAYIDLYLAMNLMSLAYYNAIRNQWYEYKGLNLVGIGKDMHVFVGNMSHVMDFTILENVEANIDPSLSQVVFGRPFMKITKLILYKEYGLITFTDGIKEVTFKTPYRDSKMDDLTSEGHDLLSSRVILSEDDYRRGCERPSDLKRGFYKDIDKLGPSYEKEIERVDLEVSFEVGGS
ncbi:MAK10-like protein [Tanacetum coccineum]